MVARLRGCSLWGAGLLLVVAGCQGPRPTPPPAVTRAPQPAPVAVRPYPTVNWTATQTASGMEPPLQPARDQLVLASYEQKPDQPARPPLGERLQLPENLPGRDAPLITLPARGPERQQAIDRHFAQLLPLPEIPQAPPGPEGRPLTLVDLENLALGHSPLVQRSRADVDAARGAAIQAGLYPNPRVGYAGDVINIGETPGTQGAFVEQTIKTGGKLKLASASAHVEVENAELTLRRVENEVRTQVRRGYFAVLMAERALTVEKAFAGLTQEVYTIQVARLKAGQAAVDEPLQARVLAVQARAVLIQGLNRLDAAWRQLAASLGLPDLPRTQLAGDLDQAVPRFLQEEALARILHQHTDMLIANNTVARAQFNLRLAQVTPVPDVSVRYQPQYDWSTLPHKYVHGVGVALDLPLWNRNQGGIREAEGRLAAASQEPARVRNELTAQLAAAFQKYESARALVLLYRDQMVPDQTRTYRSIYRRYDAQPETLNFNDVVVAQQTLAQTIRSYVESIGNLWDSVVDIAGLLQVPELMPQVVAPPERLPDHCPVPALEPLLPPQKAAMPETEQSSSLTVSQPAEVEQVGYQEPGRVSHRPGQAMFRTRDEMARQAVVEKVPFEVWQLFPRTVGFKVRPTRQ